MRDECLDLVTMVNRCQIAELEEAGSKAGSEADGRAIFTRQVENLEAAIKHTYQIVAFKASRETDPEKAALLWKEMDEYCLLSLRTLRKWKEIFPSCGTPYLYDLALDYRNEAYRRYSQNLQDAEWAKTPPPSGLFPKTT
jgi:hypothetical protein